MMGRNWEEGGGVGEESSLFVNTQYSDPQKQVLRHIFPVKSDINCSEETHALVTVCDNYEYIGHSLLVHCK